MLAELLPVIRENKLSRRVDVYVDEGAFSPEDARFYLFKPGSYVLTPWCMLISSAGAEWLLLLICRQIVRIIWRPRLRLNCDACRFRGCSLVLPGASVGLGIPFAAARKALDVGNSLAIASHWITG